MLEALGISDRATRAYVIVIDDPDVSPAELAAWTGASVPESRDDLAELAAAGLLAPAAGRACGYRPLPPDIAIGALARSRRPPTPGNPDVDDAPDLDAIELYELPPGPVAYARHAGMMGAQSGHTVAVWQSADPENPGFLAPDTIAALARRHLTVQVIQPPGAPPCAMERVQVRTRYGPSCPMTIVERRIAVLAPAGPAERGLVVRGEHLVGPLRHAFDSAWADGCPELPGSLDGIGRLLADGAKDDTIARRRGINPRTVRRQVAALLDHLGGVTRFQAGFALGRRDASVGTAGRPST